ncbi:IS4 family transposase [Arsukibacterium perlucidum]|uniref:IS4 family transposase n=1 Tax=Arsukibacterium perlucidum TaxID=368811 RepID=UPI00037BC827|nr:IS4 family transposase [Arsukibacterium perlucidum]
MNVLQMLTRFVKAVTPNMHSQRRQALEACVKSAVHQNKLTITQLGRGIHGKAFEKHKIKRADRLCSNGHLYRELPLIYGALVKLVASSLPRPVILVDWSDLDARRRHFLLRASLAFDGRSITLYEQVHPLCRKEKPAIHLAFLQHLKAMLPEQCKPIIVTDAGFRVPWFRQVLSLGWDYVGRIRNRTLYTLDSGDNWLPCKGLYAQAGSKPQCLKHVMFTRGNPLTANWVLIKAPAKNRKLLNRFGQSRLDKPSRDAAAASREPWLLGTSLPTDSAAQAQAVVNCYASRMQIEEGFRDQKSNRFGLGMSLHESRCHERLAVLVLIGTLALFAMNFIGVAAEQAGLAKRFQANTIKHRRVLSYCYIAARLIHQSELRITLKHWLSGVLYFKRKTAEYGLCWS